jgi:hypothetical protein
MAKGTRNSKYDVLSVRKERQTLDLARQLADALRRKHHGTRWAVPDAVHEAIKNELARIEAEPAEERVG